MTDIDEPGTETERTRTQTRQSTKRRVQILINDREQLETVSHLLQERFTTITADNLKQADLYIIDDNSFDSYRESLDSRKQKEPDQVFCPIVLLRRQGASLDPFADDEYTVVDQIVSTPLDKGPFLRMLENLLSWRADTKTLVEQTVELQRREEELERYETYIQESTDIILTLDESHNIEYVSPSIRRILGYSPESLIGTAVSELAHPADRPKLSDLLDGLVLQTEQIVTAELRVQTADGKTRWIELRGGNQLDNSALEVLVTNIRDITEKKQHEQELEQQNQRLEHFASVLSHDLRNPLNVAQLRTDLVAQNNEENENIQIIQKSLHRIETMIDDLLMMARAQTMTSETEPIALIQLAKAAWQTAQTKQSSMMIDMPTDYTVEGNSDLLQNVFENLYRNAVDHNEDPVTVRVGVLADQNGFFIEDDGTGIPPDERDEIFDYGYTTSQSGTGLGLSIVQNLIEAHGWTITLTEGSDGGARFEITGVDTS